MISPSPRSDWTRKKLQWLVPILIASAVYPAICFNPAAFMRDRVFFPLFMIYGLIAPVGGFWAMYQSIRYEKHPWKCLVIVILVPFGFLWYYFEKYEPRIARFEASNEVRDTDNIPR